jgi:two-component system response regulator RegX3
MHYDCLIIDDEKPLADSTAEYFNYFNINTLCVYDELSCLEFFNYHTVDVILLDVNLVKSSGFALCQKLRIITDVPILFISARTNEEDMIVALNIGGDDYIQKPYTLSVLLAKVKAVLKRHKSSKNDDMDMDTISFHNGIIDVKMGKVTVNGENVKLKAMEFKLLCYLLKNKNRIVTKEEIFDKVWEDRITSDGTLNVHIRHLREKIEENPNEPLYIKTIWGVGYIYES